MHGVMRLKVLRAVLYGMLVLMLAGIAFVAGVFVAKKTEKEPFVPVVEEVAPEKRKLARDFVEVALAERFAGRHREALDYLEKAREQDATLRGLDYQFALTQLDLRDFEAARTAARTSVAKKEETSNAQALLALIALEQARTGGSTQAVREEILRSIQESRETDPLNPMPHYVVAEFYRFAGQPELAVDAYRRALERVSKSDSIMVSTVKAGLAGLRLHHEADSPPLKLQSVNGIYPPEQLFFGAADALLRGDQGLAADYLRQARERLPEPLFEALMQDSFFQDYLPDGTKTLPPSDGPQP
jgi:tetratricopeptide (TPR) repeat protein